MRYDIHTTVTPRGDIHQTVNFVGAESGAKIQEQLLKLSEQAVIDALIGQGWTPPPGVKAKTRAWRRL